jgi:hypothetical protein
MIKLEDLKNFKKLGIVGGKLVLTPNAYSYLTTEISAARHFDPLYDTTQPTHYGDIMGFELEVQFKE